MRRRDVLALICGAVAAQPLAAGAQQKSMPVIAWLSGGRAGSEADQHRFLAPFHQGLSEVGYVEGHNVAIEYRRAEFQYDRLPELAADLVGHKPDVIVTNGGTPPALAAKNATSTIPIVFNDVADPVGFGLVANLARPGGNLTGFSSIATELTPKRIELLSELVPQAKTIALLVNPSNPYTEPMIQEAQAATEAKGVQLAILKADTESEIDAAFATLVNQHAAALVVCSDLFLGSRRQQITSLALRHAVPAIGDFREFAALGGLLSYGVSNTAIFRQVGTYAGRILKGEKPADLPVQQPAKFELVINLKTARALGLTVPQSILARADEVIE